jgi:Stage II sporulation protein E (SpoIIE)
MVSAHAKNCGTTSATIERPGSTSGAHPGNRSYHWMDWERFAFYVLDVSGHGVKSALLAVSILDTLRTCGFADTNWNDPGDVLRALNRVYFSQSRDQLYFTIWYGIADLVNGVLRYAGGYPRRRMQESHVTCQRSASWLLRECQISECGDASPFSDRSLSFFGWCVRSPPASGYQASRSPGGISCRGAQRPGPNRR